MKALSWIIALLACVVTPHMAAASLPQTASPEGARVYIISPADGEVVNSPFTVKFGLSGMGVAPAGADFANTGHHHLLIDGEALPAGDKPMGQSLKHFGGGQTEVTIDLEPGPHTIQLILGDKNHVQHNPPVISEKVTIEVK